MLRSPGPRFGIGRAFGPDVGQGLFGVGDDEDPAVGLGDLHPVDEPDRTVLHVIAGGIGPVPRLINRFWIAEKVRRVLQAAPGLR